MNVERKEESQQVQKPTEQSLCEAIENGLVDLVSEKKAFKAVTVEKLIEHLLKNPNTWSTDQCVKEIKKMIKTKKIVIWKGTTERSFKKILFPFLKRAIRPHNPNSKVHGRPKKISS